MKWLLILFLGVIIVPVFAQSTTINQTEYQKLTNSIGGLNADYKKLVNSINVTQNILEKIGRSTNETNDDFKNNYENLSNNIKGVRDDAAKYYVDSIIVTGLITIVAFFGGVFVSKIIQKQQEVKQEEITAITEEASNLTKKIKTMIENQDTLLHDKQSVYAEFLIRWIDADVIGIEDYMKKWYPEYQNAAGAEKETIRKNILHEYVLHLQTRMLPIKSIDLVEIFGKDISNAWQRLWTKCMIDIAFTDDSEGMKYLKENYDKIAEMAKNLKQKLEPFVPRTL